MRRYMRLQNAYMEYRVYIRLDIKYYEVHTVVSATAIGLFAGGVAIAP